MARRAFEVEWCAFKTETRERAIEGSFLTHFGAFSASFGPRETPKDKLKKTYEFAVT